MQRCLAPLLLGLRCDQRGRRLLSADAAFSANASAHRPDEQSHSSSSHFFLRRHFSTSLGPLAQGRALSWPGKAFSRSSTALSFAAKEAACCFAPAPPADQAPPARGAWQRG
eukprot:5834862-Pyramimonas_sp.AAC.1